MKVTDVVASIKPFVLGWISETGGGAGPYAPTPHDLNSAHHTGDLADAQFPNGLLRDGSRSLLGNLSVAAGATLDGVDLSVFKSDYDTHVGADDAHHDPVTVGSGGLSGKLSLSLQEMTLAAIDHADLSNIDANEHVDHSAVSVLAGTGLAGGGMITGNVTLNHDAGDFGDLHTNYTEHDGPETITGAWAFQNTLVTRTLRPESPDTYDIGSDIYRYRKGWLSELDAVLFAENTITLLGGWFYVTKHAGLAEEDIDSVETQIDLGASDAILSENDFIVFRSSLQMEYMQLGAYVGSNVWNVTRDVDGSGADEWAQGSPYAALGYDGDGRIEFNAYDTPRISIIRHGTAYNTHEEPIRLGDLNGLADYAGEAYGIFIGDYAGDSWMAYDPTNKLRIHGGGVIDGTLDATKLTSGFGGDLFSASDGLLLLGPKNALSSTSWTSLRGQTATISGAFHTVAGRWPGTRALMVEEAGLNYCLNPAARDADSSGTADTRWFTGTNGAGTLTPTVVAHPVEERGWMQRVQYTSPAGETNKYVNIYTLSNTGTFAAGQDATVSADVRGQVSSGASVQLLAVAYNSADSSLGQVSSGAIQISPNMRRFEVTYENLPANTSYVGIILQAYSIDAGETVDMYLGAVNIEKALYPTSYMYGELAHCSWSGTAHASTSTRTATEINLDAHAALLSANDAWSLSLWWQPQYDADATWSTGVDLFDMRGADNNHRTLLRYNRLGTQEYSVYINGDWRIDSAAQSFTAGEWQLVVITYDFFSNSYQLFINGVLDESDATSLSAPTLTEMNLGSTYDANRQINAAVSELALFDDVLTATEVAALYHRNAPLADYGAMDTPGIYILDGKFRIASSTTGNRIEMTPEELAGYDAAGTKQFYLRASDGKAVAGGGDIVLGEDYFIDFSLDGVDMGFVGIIEAADAINGTNDYLAISSPIDGSPSNISALYIAAESIQMVSQDTSPISTIAAGVYTVGTPNTFAVRNAASGLTLDYLTVDSAHTYIKNYLEMEEMTAPAAPSANYGRIFMRDNGSGKTQLCVRFASGAIQVISTEP